MRTEAQCRCSSKNEWTHSVQYTIKPLSGAANTIIYYAFKVRLDSGLREGGRKVRFLNGGMT